MSWGISAGAAATTAAANSIPVSSAEAPTTGTGLETTAEADAHAPSSPSTMCFVCSRCEYPICTSQDLLHTPVPRGTTDDAFAYDLEYLLDLREGVTVPCYCCEETVDTAIVVSERLSEEPLPQSVRLMCLESIVESRKFLRAQQSATVARLMHRREGAAAPVHGSNRHSVSSSHSTGTSGRGDPPVGSVGARTADAELAHAPLPPASAADAGSVADNAGHEHDMRLAESLAGGGQEGDPASGDADPNTNIAPAEQEHAGARAAAEDAAPPPPPPHATTTTASTNDTTTSTAPPASEWPTLRPVRRYGATTEARVDLVAIRRDVLGVGLALSARDRSAAACPVDTASGGGGGGGTAAHLPRDIVDAASQAPPRTAWGPPGNLTVEEAFIAVTRATSSAQGGWFHAFTCVDRLECPDCHMPLGFLFERTRGAARAGAALESRVPPHCRTGNGGGAGAAEEEGTERGIVTAGSAGASERLTGTEEESEEASVVIERHPQVPPGRVPVFASLAYERGVQQTAGGSALEGARRPRGGETATTAADATAKRAKTETTTTTATTTTTTSTTTTTCEEREASPEGAVDDAASFPDVFIGLELKRMKQLGWGLREFQERYAKSQSLRTFRDMFPEAEELLSLYSRLSALRTQSELYNNLLRKHREQNDVQTSLIHSQKERIATYAGKLLTMQQIINAQRMQLEMQTAQIKRQEELMRSHRQQVSTQQQQIDVEQMLLAEQTKTIESQRAQIRLMRAQLLMRAAQAPHPAPLAAGAVEMTTHPTPPSVVGAVPAGESAGEAAGSAGVAGLRSAELLRAARRATDPATVGATPPTTVAAAAAPQPPAHLRGVYGTARAAAAMMTSASVAQEGEKTDVVNPTEAPPR